MENFAGADLHKKVTQLGLLRKGKPPSQFRFSNDPHTVEKVLSRLPSGTKIAVEATSTWWWFVEKVRELGHEVYLSHPKQTKAIASARLKSDKVDALMPARLLKADLLPMVWIPPWGKRAIRARASNPSGQAGQVQDRSDQRVTCSVCEEEHGSIGQGMA